MTQDQHRTIIGESVCCIGKIGLTADTGRPALKPEQIHRMIVAAGGHYHARVMTDTDLVVVGAEPDGQLAQAIHNGIERIDELELIPILEASRVLIQGAPKLLKECKRLSQCLSAAASMPSAIKDGRADTWICVVGDAGSAVQSATPREQEDG